MSVCGTTYSTVPTAKMPKRERISKQKAVVKREETVEAAPPKKVDTEAMRTEMDDILDEIDLVLEENAEEFVKGYIQKGGE